MKQKKGLIFVLSGPSGSGKTTLLKKIQQRKKLKKRIEGSVSYSTRPRRSNEKNVEDYRFVSQKDFLRLIKNKKILEWTKYLGYYYGTPKKFIEERLQKGRNIILSVDLKGALKIKNLYPDISTLIFIMPPSLKELRKRIERRCKKTKGFEVRERLKLATKEIKKSEFFDYCLVNKDLDKVLKRLEEIILGKIKKGRK